MTKNIKCLFFYESMAQCRTAVFILVLFLLGPFFTHVHKTLIKKGPLTVKFWTRDVGNPNPVCRTFNVWRHYVDVNSRLIFTRHISDRSFNCFTFGYNGISDIRLTTGWKQRAFKGSTFFFIVKRKEICRKLHLRRVSRSAEIQITGVDN